MDLMTDAMRDAARRSAREHMERAERAIMRLLGAWVSELPATIAYDQDYRVIGLSYGGRIVVHADAS